jgi:hypothetical protein
VGPVEPGAGISRHRDRGGMHAVAVGLDFVQPALVFRRHGDQLLEFAALSIPGKRPRRCGGRLPPAPCGQGRGGFGAGARAARFQSIRRRLRASHLQSRRRADKPRCGRHARRRVLLHRGARVCAATSQQSQSPSSARPIRVIWPRRFAFGAPAQTMIQEIGFAADSPLEQRRFELSVPPPCRDAGGLALLRSA